MTRQEFIAKVHEKMSIKGSLVSDAILDVALHADIDVETAARIIASNSELKKLLEEESIIFRTIKPKPSS